MVYDHKRYDRMRKRRTYLRLQLIVAEEKLNRGCCMDCGMVVYLHNVVCFDFDHRERRHKVASINHLRKNASEEALRDEMSKCDLVCSNCHRLRGALFEDWGPRDRIPDPHPTLFDMLDLQD